MWYRNVFQNGHPGRSISVNCYQCVVCTIVGLSVGRSPSYNGSIVDLVKASVSLQTDQCKCSLKLYSDFVVVAA